MCSSNVYNWFDDLSSRLVKSPPHCGSSPSEACILVDSGCTDPVSSSIDTPAINVKLAKLGWLIIVEIADCVGAMKDLQVVVVGAGIGGLCTALALATDGHKITVLEEAPKFLEVRLQFRIYYLFNS